MNAIGQAQLAANLGQKRLFLHVRLEQFTLGFRKRQKYRQTWKSSTRANIQETTRRNACNTGPEKRFTEMTSQDLAGRADRRQTDLFIPAQEQPEVCRNAAGYGIRDDWRKFMEDCADVLRCRNGFRFRSFVFQCSPRPAGASLLVRLSDDARGIVDHWTAFAPDFFRKLTAPVGPIKVSLPAMKILVIGGGGREHALAWKLAQSADVQHVWCAPGNDGMVRSAECVPASVKDTAALNALAQNLRPDLTVVGPEVPLVAGLADEFAESGLKIVGPRRSAARLEGSKIFAKQFLERKRIPTAGIYGIYDSANEAHAAIEKVQLPVVIKADGPCAGKGVLVTNSREEAQAFLSRLMEKREFGVSGSQVLLEEALEGKELSFIVLTDGEHILPLAPARDHKRAFDGDQGPNTGGMGAFSVEGMIPKALWDEILTKVVRPTIDGMAREGSPYVGFLYCGLMLTDKGPQVLEYNCRMGDPECQAIVARMDFDLAEALAAVAEGKLDGIAAKWNPAASVCVVLASGGYPGHYETGKPIAGLEEAEEGGEAVVFHAGTRLRDGRYTTAGGRVLGVTATGGDLGSASARAYAAAGRIRFGGMQYRKDIGTNY